MFKVCDLMNESAESRARSRRRPFLAVGSAGRVAVISFSDRAFPARATGEAGSLKKTQIINY